MPQGNYRGALAIEKPTSCRDNPAQPKQKSCFFFFLIRTKNNEAVRGNQQVYGQGLLRGRFADTSEYWFQITQSKNHVKITKETRYINI